MDGPENNGAGPGATPEPAVNTVAEGANSPGSESITPGATPNQDDAKTALPPAYAAFRAECEAAGMSEAEVLAASRDRKQKQGPPKKRRNDEPPFLALGHDHGTYSFFTQCSDEVIQLSAAQLAKRNLQTLAPLDYWKAAFPGRRGADWDAATEHLIGECNRRGTFAPDRVRGRGACREGERLLSHAGDHLEVAETGERVQASLSSWTIFERGRAVPLGDRPASAAEGLQVVALFSSLGWKNEACAPLCAGWVFLAPICGALTWRPHAWIVGPAGTGKSQAIARGCRTARRRARPFPPVHGG